eukprot:TRINITY_DN2784_c0_g2_i1.p1 TRINITY_DN2784_c0_g2~~TRINITY_DN2784_c0_g2_i1.p1  ORF type:complete len:165 (-),score=41.88 TRINITY_DN2784_c0_g2_i1:124-567(-)
MIKLALAFFLLVSLFSSSFSATEAQCTEWGFGSDLSCENCKKLGEVVSDTELVSECNKCCREEENSKEEVYSKAQLVVCRWQLKEFPHIYEFVNKKLHQYKKLELQFQQGRRPTLLMFDQKGQIAKTLSLSSWKTEEVEEYLKAKLK